jgi:hypothetical protein
MTNRFMISVAALALIAGTGFANAQGMGKESGGSTMGKESGGSTMQHSSPADTSAGQPKSDSSSEPGKSQANESSKDSSKSGMKASQSEPKKSGAMKNDRAEDNVKGGSTNQRAEDRGKGTSADQRADDAAKSGMKSEGRDKAEGRDNNMKAEGRQDKNGVNSAETKGAGERSQTTGQAGAGAKLTSDQRTKITTVIRNEHAAPVNNVNFSIAVGSRVPREGVSFRPLPAEVVTIYPEWRGYEYILVRNQIVVIDPRTYEIVDVIDT